MTTGQAPIRIKTGNALDVEDTTSNVAINQAMMEALSAANIDGKDVYPNYVGAQHPPPLTPSSTARSRPGA